MCSEEALALPSQWSVLVSGAAVLMAARPRPRSWLSARAVRGSPALLETEGKRPPAAHLLPSSHQRRGRQSRLSAFLIPNPCLPIFKEKKKKEKRKEKTKQKPYNRRMNILSKLSLGGTWSDCYYSFFSTCSLGGKLSNLEHSIPEEQVLMLRVKGTHLC